MAVAQAVASEQTTGGGIFVVNFNQDFTSLGIGTKRGYKLFTIGSDDKIEQICDNENEDTCILERLFSSSLVAVVSMSSPRKLKVCHFKKKSEICNYSYPNTILAVKLNRLRLIVCLEESLYIHNIRDMKVLHTIRDTPPNPSGLCILSSSNDNCYLAYPGSNTIGQIQIFDAQNLQAKTMIPAHESPLAALAFNEAGTKIATASEKGTVIRVFNVADGSRLYEFRRGMKRCATIYSLSFSNNSLFLISSSNTETVHIFKLEDIKETPHTVQEDQSLMGWVSNVVSASANYLPAPVTDILSQGRAFATVTLPFLGMRNTCAITTIQKQPRVAVATADGFLYLYNLNTLEGGECTLIKQHRLFGNVDGDNLHSGDAIPIPMSTGYPGSAQKTESTERTRGTSYARAVRGSQDNAPLTEVEKLNEMAAACETPPTDTLGLNDENEYPPM